VLEVEAIVAEKLYDGTDSKGRPAENVALLDKIRKFLRINSLPIFSVRCNKTPVWYCFVVHLL